MKHYVSCLECDFPLVKVDFEQKYNGLRGICPKCGIDWPES